MHRIEAWAYLRDLLCLLADRPAHRILQLAPASWRETSAQQTTRTALDADPYRTLTLRG